MVKRVAIPKKLRGFRSFVSSWKQNPVVDLTAGKFTAVSLISYHHTTGLIMRSSKAATLVGYCVESPRNVLENVFRDYQVTRYNSYELFDSIDFEPTTPMLGLGIAPVGPPNVYGITYHGRLADILQLDELQKVKRIRPISHNDIDRIIAHLVEESGHGFINPNFNQNKHNKQEIIDIVKKFR
jgi:hypothetical protein